MLKQTEKTVNIESLDNNYERTLLEGVPLYLDDSSNQELVTMADVIRAEQKRIAKKFGLNEYNLFELALLFADVKQRVNAIRQKFRFNKMIFYIGKGLEKEYGNDVIRFDTIASGRSGPIPVHLKEDLLDLKEKGLVELYLVKDGKKIPGSKEKWIELKDKLQASIECALTKEGEKISKNLWTELSDEIKEIILKTKAELMYLDTEKLKEKVHKEYPNLKKEYVEDDKETFEEFLV